MRERRSTASVDALDVELGRLLQIGVLIAASVVFLGGVLFLVRHGQEIPSYGQFRSEPENLRTVRGILRSANALGGRGFIQLGLLLLVATPVARVLFAAVAFLRQRDWKFAAISSVVLALLLWSVLGGVR